MFLVPIAMRFGNTATWPDATNERSSSTEKKDELHTRLGKVAKTDRFHSNLTLERNSWLRAYMNSHELIALLEMFCTLF